MHLPDEAPHRRIDLVGAAAGAVDPHAQIQLDGRVQVAPLECRLLLGVVAAHLLGPLVAREAGSHEHEPLDELRSRECDLDRHASAKRAADDGGRAEREPVEQVGDVAGVREALRRKRRPAEPAQVAPDRPVRQRECPPLLLPRPAVADPLMEQQDGRSLTGNLMPQLH